MTRGDDAVVCRQNEQLFSVTMYIVVVISDEDRIVAKILLYYYVVSSASICSYPLKSRQLIPITNSFVECKMMCNEYSLYKLCRYVE